MQLQIPAPYVIDGGRQLGAIELGRSAAGGSLDLLQVLPVGDRFRVGAYAVAKPELVLGEFEDGTSALGKKFARSLMKRSA